MLMVRGSASFARRAPLSCSFAMIASDAMATARASATDFFMEASRNNAYAISRAALQSVELELSRCRFWPAPRTVARLEVHHERFTSRVSEGRRHGGGGHERRRSRAERRPC